MEGSREETKESLRAERSHTTPPRARKPPWLVSHVRFHTEAASKTPPTSPGPWCPDHHARALRQTALNRHGLRSVCVFFFFSIRGEKKQQKKMSTYNKGGQPAQIDQKRQIPLLGTSEHSPAQAAAIKSLSMESPSEIKGACL